ncbi:hypothetical protein DFR58_1137 [Anaerobacterium chartisolvens]|uniref:Uncharacterized protein n=1 Tax=Anaerobacterium chartisolvens TaxID=1297424 RepID=A0A369B4F0_9FIRM|nr:hypothetical protein [Anaerobacterium chartisolvens]RCX15427.1 hypothetical protein DFR58_1137 [Anaerobacterium chartisolvens]
MRGRQKSGGDVLIIKKYSGRIRKDRLLYKLIRLLAANIDPGGE